MKDRAFFFGFLSPADRFSSFRYSKLPLPISSLRSILISLLLLPPPSTNFHEEGKNHLAGRVGGGGIAKVLIVQPL